MNESVNLTKQSKKVIKIPKVANQTIQLSGWHTLSFNKAKEIELKWCKGKQFQFSNGTLSCFLGICSRGSFSSTVDMDWSLNHSLQRNRPLKRKLNQTHLRQLSQIPNPSQTHLSHLIEALNQLAKREVPSFMRD